MCETTVSASATIRPRWALLYTVALSGVTALALVERAAPAGRLRTVVLCVIALSVFLAVAAWVRWNRAALDLLEWCDCAPRMVTVTVRVIESPRRSEWIVADRPGPAPAWIEEERELAHR
jgi:uncharacterized membrane protein